MGRGPLAGRLKTAARIGCRTRKREHLARARHRAPCGRGHRRCRGTMPPLGLPGPQSPRPAPLPGRAPACRCAAGAGLCGCVAQGRGKGGASRGPAQGAQAPFPDRKKVPGRQTVGLPFQHPVRAGKAAGGGAVACRRRLRGREASIGKITDASGAACRAFRPCHGPQTRRCTVPRLGRVQHPEDHPDGNDGSGSGSGCLPMMPCGSGSAGIGG